MKKIRGIVCDLDGTLVDPLGTSMYSVVNQVLSQKGIEWVDRGFETKQGTLKNVISHNLPPNKQHDEALIDEIAANVTKIYESRAIGKAQAYPGINEFLAVAGVRRIPVAILTNKEEEMARRVAKEIFPSFSFFAIKGVSFHALDLAKPNPIQLEEILQAMGFSEQECIFLGDSPSDEETARRVGCLFGAALWGFSARADFKEKHSLFFASVFLWSRWVQENS